MRRFDFYGFAVCLIVAFAFCGLGTSKAMAKEKREYVPFVEEGKTWYCYYPYSGGGDNPGRSLGNGNRLHFHHVWRHADEWQGI